MPPMMQTPLLQMTDNSETAQATGETSLPPTEARVKAPRSEAQIAALERARIKAQEARGEAAALRKKEQEVERAMVAKARAERAARVEAEYKALTTPVQEVQEEETSPPPEPETPAKPMRKKPARRVIVTEVSSGEETDEEVEVVLPKARKAPPQPTAEELMFQRSMTKMFTYG